MTVAIALAAYAALLLAVAVASLRWGRDMEGFLVAGRSQPKYLVVASMLASTIGGGITIGTVTRAGSIGFAAFWFVAAGAFAHFLQGAFLSRKVRDSEALTLAELADKAAGPAARAAVSAIVVVTWTGIAAAQFAALARVLDTLVALPYAQAVAVAAAFVVLYTLIGGQKSVLRTDLFQFGVLAAAILGSAAWLYLAKPPAPGSLRVELFSPAFGPLDLAYQVFVMGGSYFVCPMMFSRLLSAKSGDEARRSSFLSGTGMLLFAFAITFVGLWASATGFDSAGKDTLNAIARDALPRPLGVLLVFGLLAAIVSTADTVLLTAAGIVQNDLVKKPSVAAVRAWTVAVGAAGAAIALYHGGDVIGLLMKTYNGYTAGLVPALTVALFASGMNAGRASRLPRAGLFAAALAGGWALGTAGSLSASPVLQKTLPMAGMAVSVALSLAAYRVSSVRPSAAE